MEDWFLNLSLCISIMLLSKLDAGLQKMEKEKGEMETRTILPSGMMGYSFYVLKNNFHK